MSDDAYLKGEQRVSCQNCDWCGRARQLKVKFPDIPDLAQRVAPGEIVPYGECPKCGALVHEIDE